MKRKKNIKPSPLDLELKALAEFNKKHHTSYSYGQYVAMKGGATVRCPVLGKHQTIVK